MVKKIVEAGCTNIYVIDKDANLLKQLHDEFPMVKSVNVDLLDWEETRKAVESFGPVDHVINNAGIPEAERVLEITSGGIDRCFKIDALRFKLRVTWSKTSLFFDLEFLG